MFKALYLKQARLDKNVFYGQLDEERIREIDKQGKGMEARRRWKVKPDVLSLLIARWLPVSFGNGLPERCS